MIIFTAVFLITAESCRKTKDLPKCTGNCTDVVFSGSVYDQSSGSAKSGVETKIYLNPIRVGELDFFNTNYIIASGKTGSNGSFTFHAQYDTVKYKSYFVEVNATIPDGYVQYPTIIVPNATVSPSSIAGLTFNPTDFAAFRNLSFTLFQKTLLHINMHRNTPVANDPSVSVDLFTNGRSSLAGFQQTAANKDTVMSAYTGANVYTVITASKAISATGYSNVKDSIKCTKKGPNTIDIYY